MKKTILICGLLMLATVSLFAQHREILRLGEFERVKLDGNIRLYVEQDRNTEVVVEARKESYLDEYSMAVRNGVLYIKYRIHGVRTTPKLKVYLTHPELKGIDMDGLIHFNSKNTLRGETLAIKGDGLIRGTVDVDVQDLKVGLDGMCFMSFAGNAERSDLRLDGLGRIDATDLVTTKVHKSAEGLASIRMGH